MIQEAFKNILNNCTMAREVPVWHVDALELKYHKRRFQYWDRSVLNSCVITVISRNTAVNIAFSFL